jgi:hypothetical protein
MPKHDLALVSALGHGDPEAVAALISAGADVRYKREHGYDALLDTVHSRDVARDPPPVWCAMRFGQSITLLPDGRVVQSGGEHEDDYDPDFCIYNDVFVHNRDGSIIIFGYPEAVFPPTDFHTATLIDGGIYVIGALGYAGKRLYGQTPVHRLDTGTFRMERLDLSGEEPGWIYDHRAVRVGPHEIRVSGGKVVTAIGGEEIHTDNAKTFLLDVESLIWRRES